MNLIPIGVDTETSVGKPITFQFYSKDLSLTESIFHIKNSKYATRQFFAFLDSLPNIADRHYVLFGHNLAFDMVSLFYDRHARLIEEKIDNEKWYGWDVDIVFAAVKFAVFKKGKIHVSLIDTGAYFVRKLADLATLFCPSLPKLDMPKGLGTRDFKPKDKDYKLFYAYAMRDAEIAYHIGLKLLSLHKQLDVSLCVSAPHFASKVFRKHFLKETIPLPPTKIVYASMSAYHGGKNNITVTMGRYEKVFCLDISSAYPFAMSTFPSFSDPDLYKILQGSGDLSGQQLPPYGIYKISGIAKPCKWPIIYDHQFKPVQGDIRGIWATGFEINEALRAKEIEITDLYGYYYDADSDKNYSPFKAYAEKFYNDKSGATDKIYREFWKLLLNSLYGKFIQTRGMSTISNLVFDEVTEKLIEDNSIVAGGLFNPFIAALITGHTRAYLHRLEHKYKALHSSTDGIMTQIKPKTKAGLGGLAIEAQSDFALIFRNKLYILYAKTKRGEKPATPSKVFKGYHLIKYAKHGFHGDIHTLEHCYKTGIYEYEFTRVNKLRESLRRKLQVNDFVTGRATLTLTPKKRKIKIPSTSE